MGLKVRLVLIKIAGGETADGAYVIDRGFSGSSADVLDFLFAQFLVDLFHGDFLL